VKIFGFEIGRKSQGESIDVILQRLEALVETAAGIVVTPETCEQAPTVQAVVNAVSRHFQAMPVQVLRKTRDSKGRESKEQLPNHPVARLLSRPNQWQTSVDFWGDVSSVLVRHGRAYSIKMQGSTGPIRYLIPVYSGSVEPILSDDYSLTYRIITEDGKQRIYEPWEVFCSRNRARDFLNGDSPVVKAKDAIALEIAAQRFGSEFFSNGAMPGLIFKYAENFRGHQTKEARDKFVESVQEAYGSKKRFRALLLPSGIAEAKTVEVNNEATQFLDTRKLQRTIIAGAFGVPPHLVGDLERGTFSNIEHQSQEFLNEVILPYARIFEAAMWRDLLTDDDRRSGVVVRFNLDAIQRADFKTRQEGMKIQREMGVINADEWREREGMNPIPEEQGGEVYWQQGPSGQNAPEAAAEVSA
jgi:HK97 family phage portal protein